jgi:hypothetical protein
MASPKRLDTMTCSMRARAARACTPEEEISADSMAQAFASMTRSKPGRIPGNAVWIVHAAIQITPPARSSKPNGRSARFRPEVMIPDA